MKSSLLFQISSKLPFILALTAEVAYYCFAILNPYLINIRSLNSHHVWLHYHTLLRSVRTLLFATHFYHLDSPVVESVRGMLSPYRYFHEALCNSVLCQYYLIQPKSSLLHKLLLILHLRWALTTELLKIRLALVFAFTIVQCDSALGFSLFRRVYY